MGLAMELGYVFPRPNAASRGLQAFASTRFGAWMFSKTLARTDRIVGTLSKGRLSVPAVLARLPVLTLTTTGRKSGQPRSTHLIAVPYRDTLALLGTNFGQASTPSWVLNLESEPRAVVVHGGVTLDVVARAASEDERAEILETSSRYYVGYQKYQQRISGRVVRIFVLEPCPVDPPEPELGPTAAQVS